MRWVRKHRASESLRGVGGVTGACPGSRRHVVYAAAWSSPQLPASQPVLLQMCAISDAAHGLRAFTAFFETISELDRTGGWALLPVRCFLVCLSAGCVLWLSAPAC